MAEVENADYQEIMFVLGFPLCKEWIERCMGHKVYRDFCWKICAIYMASRDDTKKIQSFESTLYEYLDSICFKGEQT